MINHSKKVALLALASILMACGNNTQNAQPQQQMQSLSTQYPGQFSLTAEQQATKTDVETRLAADAQTAGLAARLALSDQQVAEIKQLFANFKAEQKALIDEMMALRARPTDEQIARFKAAFSALHDKIKAKLSDAQKAELEKIVAECKANRSAPPLP